MFYKKSSDILGSVCKMSDLRLWEKEGIFNLIGGQPKVHRKYWEIGFVLSNLKKLNLLDKGKKGLVFGCGNEATVPALANQGVLITATDQPLNTGVNSDWDHSAQFCRSVFDFANFNNIIGPFENFCKNIKFYHVDMNDIQLNEKNFDFLWSNCSLEHLGSMQKSFDFIINSMYFLKSNGAAIHTTEFDWKKNESLNDSKNCVFNKTDIIKIRKLLASHGHLLTPIDYSLGVEPQDMFIDNEPYPFNNDPPLLSELSDKGHMKLLGRFRNLTSIGFIVLKNKIKIF